MEYIAYTVKGIEDVAIQEIEELTKAKAKQVMPSLLLFECDEKKINELIYVTRSLTRICSLFSRFQFKLLSDIENEAKKIKFNLKGTFAVRCIRQGEHSFHSHDVEVAVGNIADGNVDLSNPDNIIFVDIADNECIIGLLLTKKELQKRDYRIKANPMSINPCVAYAMIRLSEWKAKESLLDPFSKDGVMAIEAAMYACGIPRGYFSNEGKIEAIDKKIKRDELKVYAYDPMMPNVKSTEINSKLASVNKQITFSRTDLDWLDTKFGKNAIDRIVTSIHSLRDEKLFEKDCKEFFYQAEYILKKKGKIVVAVQKADVLKKYADKFKLKEERMITIGEMSYFVLVFEKK